MLYKRRKINGVRLNNQNFSNIFIVNKKQVGKFKKGEKWNQIGKKRLRVYSHHWNDTFEKLSERLAHLESFAKTEKYPTF